jgi:hypothetical protein
VLILVVLVALAVLSRGGFSLIGLVINAAVGLVLLGLVLLVLTNLFIYAPDTHQHPNRAHLHYRRGDRMVGHPDTPYPGNSLLRSRVTALRELPVGLGFQRVGDRAKGLRGLIR